jgi:hypothetical protein
MVDEKKHNENLADEQPDEAIEDLELPEEQQDKVSGGAFEAFDKE